MDQGAKTPPRFTMRTMQMDFEAVQKGEVQIKPNPVFFEPVIEAPKPVEEKPGEKKETKPEEASPEVVEQQPEKKGPFSFFKKIFSRKEKIDIEKEELPAYLREVPEAPQPKTLITESFNPKATGGPVVTAEPRDVAREAFGPGLAQVHAPKTSVFSAPRIPPPQTPPEEKEAESAQEFSVPDEKKLAKNRFILILGVVFLLAALGFGIYSYVMRPKEEVKKPDDGKKTDIVLPAEKIKPASLFRYDEEFSVDAGASDIIPSVQKHYENGTIAGSVANVNIKKGEDYLTFAEVADKLKIIFPPKLIDNVESYNFMVYSESDGGIRGGLALKIKDPDEIDKTMLEWEEVVTVSNGASPLFLGANYSEPSSLIFKENTYKNVFIRYQNFNDPSLTFDYAIFGNKNILVMATSKNMIYEAINRIMSQ